MVLNGSADVSFSGISDDSASSSLLGLNTFYDLFGDDDVSMYDFDNDSYDAEMSNIFEEIENYSEEAYASIMDEEVSVFNYLQPNELEFCEKYTKQQVCFNEDEFSDCQCPQSVLFQKYRLLAFIIMFVLPTIVVTVSYICLIRTLKLNWSSLKDAGVNRKSSQQKSKDLQARLTKMFIVLISVFMLTWAPVEITNFCYVIGVTKNLSANACGYLKFITMNLVWISSVSNSIIYIIMCGLFKNEEKRNSAKSMNPNLAARYL